MRVPAIIRWPRKVPAGFVTNEMLVAVDWLPTLAGMVGAWCPRIVDPSTVLTPRPSCWARATNVKVGDDFKGYKK